MVGSNRIPKSWSFHQGGGRGTARRPPAPSAAQAPARMRRAGGDLTFAGVSHQKANRHGPRTSQMKSRNLESVKSADARI